MKTAFEDIQIVSRLGADERTLAFDVLDGLTRPFKEIPPKHFYDTDGSRLFEAITTLPEYYPTRTERAILEANAARIVEATGMAELVELGSGVPTKTLLLLDAMRDAGTLDRYVPFDVSEVVLRESAEMLVERYPGVRVYGVVGDFERHLDALPPAEGPRVIAFLGGTIGNFPPGSRRRFLRGLARALRPQDATPARHRPREGPGGARGRLQRQRGRDRGLQSQRAGGHQPRARRRLRPRARSSTSRSTTASRSGSRCACARCARSTCTCASSGSTCTSPTARSCARRSARSSPVSGWRPTWPRPDCSLREFLTDPDDLFALSVAGPVR